MIPPQRIYACWRILGYLNTMGEPASFERLERQLNDPMVVDGDAEECIDLERNLELLTKHKVLKQTQSGEYFVPKNKVAAVYMFMDSFKDALDNFVLLPSSTDISVLKNILDEVEARQGKL